MLVWNSSEWRELASILLTGQAKFHAGNTGLKDLMIAYLYSGVWMLAVYKSLMGLSFHWLLQSNRNTPSNFSVLYIIYFINKLKPQTSLWFFVCMFVSTFLFSQLFYFSLSIPKSVNNENMLVGFVKETFPCLFSCYLGEKERHSHLVSFLLVNFKSGC